MPDTARPPEMVLSVVSHRQRELLLGLLEDLRRNVTTPFRLIVTENLPEAPRLGLTTQARAFIAIRDGLRPGDPVVQVPVEDSAATAAAASSGGTPGWGTMRNAARISVSFGV